MTTVKGSSVGISPQASDAEPAIAAALAKLNEGDTLVLDSSGTYTISSPITLPGKRITLDCGNNEISAPGQPHLIQSINPGDSNSVIKNFTGKCGTSTGLYIAGTQTINASNFVLRLPQYTGVQVMNGANVRLSNFTIMGDGKNSAQNHGVYSQRSSVSISGGRITGCWRGIYTVSMINITVTMSKVNAFWWHLLPNHSSQESTVTSSTETTAVVGSLAMPDSFAWPTNIFTAYEKLGTATLTVSGTLKPNDGNWYTVSGLSASKIEPRLVITAGNAFGTVVETNGSSVRVDMWFDPVTRFPISAPSTVSNATIELPYIGVNRGGSGAISGGTVTVERWMVGGDARDGRPPAGSRIVVSQACDYQCFSVKANGDSVGTKSYNVSYTTVYNSYCDSISSIGNVDTRVMYNTIYDGEDVGITLQWGTGVTQANNNKTYRQGTASIFIGSSNAVVNANESHGAQYIATNKQMYGAFQVEGADSVTVTNNYAESTGSPWEVRGLLVEGRYGAKAALGDLTSGPFSTNGTYSGNTFNGYEQRGFPDVTFQGTHESVKSANWGSAKLEYLENATPAMAGL